MGWNQIATWNHSDCSIGVIAVLEKLEGIVSIKARKPLRINRRVKVEG